MSVMDMFNDRMGYAQEKTEHVIELLLTHAHLLNQVVERLDAQLARDEFVRHTGTAVVAADGTAEIELRFRAGYVHRLVGLATSSGAAAGSVAIYLGTSIDPQNLVYANGGATLLSDTFPDGTMLPERTALIVRFTGQAAASTVTAAIQAERLATHVPVAVPGVPY